MTIFRRLQAFPAFLASLRRNGTAGLVLLRRLLFLLIRIFRSRGLKALPELWRRTRALASPVPPGAYTPAGVQDYAAWIRERESLDIPSAAQVAAELADWQDPPLISIVMPVYNPDPAWLESAAASVLGQDYPHWELCIADDCSTAPGTRDLLLRLAGQDQRIRLCFRPQNGHISEASNSAIELASGDWIALLDQDDLLPRHALFRIAQAIRDNAGAQLIYSDEDKIEEGRRFGPYFKPDWNPDLLRSQNMISHLGVYRTDRVRRLGGFRKGFEGAQDLDLALRFVEGLPAESILHVPAILYHWRCHDGSTAKSISSKSYAAGAGERAIGEHLRRTGAAGTVKAAGPGMYRVRYALPEPVPLVSIIIRVKDSRHLWRCLRSIARHGQDVPHEIILAGSRAEVEGLAAKAARICPGLRVAAVSGPGTTDEAMAHVLREVRGTVLCFLDPACEVRGTGWLRELVSLVMLDGVGAVGAGLWYPGGRLFHGGYVLGIKGLAGHAHRYLPYGHYGHGGRASVIQTMSAVSSACLAVKRRDYEAAGGFDAALPPGPAQDIGFCLALGSLGRRTVWTPYASLYHHAAGAEDGAGIDPQAIRLLENRWGRALEMDPAYNPNLTREHEDFSLARTEGGPAYSATGLQLLSSARRQTDRN